MPSWRGSPYFGQIKQAVNCYNGNLVNKLLLNPLIRLSGYQVYSSPEYCWRPHPFSIVSLRRNIIYTLLIKYESTEVNQ